MAEELKEGGSTPTEGGRRKRVSVAEPLDFRILEMSKRPRLEMILRRSVNDDGADSVVAEAFVPRSDDSGDWAYMEEVVFPNVPALRSYIAEFGEGAARSFYIRAKQEAERNTAKADE